MAGKEFRVMYRRRGNKARQYRVFRQEKAARRFLRSLNRNERWEPVAEAAVDRREVGQWERFWTLNEEESE
jgi:hypothetical protein